MIKSPCIDKCGLVDGVCKGCKRTGKEIAKWKRMTDEEKQKVLDRIENLVICPRCKHTFDYLSMPESGMGYIKCPKCNEPITQKYLK